MVRLYQTAAHQKFYSAPLISLQTIVALVFLVGLVLIPFAISYGSDDYWLKQSQYREQAKVRFQFRYIMEIGGTNSGIPFTVFAASDPAIVLPITSIQRTPVVNVYSFNARRLKSTQTRMDEQTR